MEYKFYLWRNRIVDSSNNIITRTCFGITSNIDKRINGYEGHVGHIVVFEKVWAGPERLIRELESKLKLDFDEYLFCGHRNFRYEWIDERISFDQIVKYVAFEVENVIGITLN